LRGATLLLLPARPKSVASHWEHFEAPFFSLFILPRKPALLAQGFQWYRSATLFVAPRSAAALVSKFDRQAGIDGSPLPRLDLPPLLRTTSQPFH